MPSGHAKWRPLLLLALGAACLRILVPGPSRLSLDEAFRLLWSLDPSLPLSQSSLGHIGAAGNVLLQRWLHGLTDSVAALRLPAMLAGTLAVPLFYNVARRVALPRTAALAGWLLCLSPLHLAYSRRAEHYAFTALFAVMGLHLAMDISRGCSVGVGRLVKIAAVEVLGFLLGGYFILPFWLALASGALFFRIRNRAPVPWAGLLAAQLPFLALLAWIFSSWTEASGELMPAYLQKGLGAIVFSSLRLAPPAMLVDLVAQVGLWRWGVPLPFYWRAAEWLLAGVLILLVGYGCRRTTSPEPAGRGSGALFSSPESPISFLLWSVVATPLLLYLALRMFFPEPRFFVRALLPALPGLLLLIAVGWMRSPRWLRGIAATTFGPMMLLGAMAVVTNRHPAYPRYFEQASGQIAFLAQKQVPVYLHPAEMAPLFTVADETLAPALRPVAYWGSLTIHAGENLARGLAPAEFNSWASKIADGQGCLLSVAPFLQVRDPAGKLASLMVSDYGYKTQKIGFPVFLLCPPQTAALLSPAP